jgi:glycosyltransferase involved in cell wall biosynthesis
VKLVASVIAKDEMDRYLPLAIGHLLTFCDEIRVLDDGSTDGTFEWLGGLREPVLVKRNPGPAFYEYESRARQNLLQWTMQARPDFVLSIDADEFVSDPGTIRLLADQGRNPVYTLDMEEVWSCDAQHLHIRIDGMWKSRLCPILWRAPETWTSQWDIPDRKLACGREPAIVRRTKFKRSGSSVFHFGWARRAERERRAERYFEHDKGNFHASRHLQSILWDDARVQTRPRPWPAGLSDLAASLADRAQAPGI